MRTTVWYFSRVDVVRAPPLGLWGGALVTVFLTTLSGVGLGLLISTTVSSSDKAMSVVPLASPIMAVRKKMSTQVVGPEGPEGPEEPEELEEPSQPDELEASSQPEELLEPGEESQDSQPELAT